MLSIGLLKGGSDVGAYYAADDYYSADAAELEVGLRDGAEPAIASDTLDAGAGGSKGDSRAGACKSEPGEGDGEPNEGEERSTELNGAQGEDRESGGRTSPGSDATAPNSRQPGAEGRGYVEDASAVDVSRGKGQWFGRGAEALGLQGRVDPQVLNAMIRGELPNGDVLGTRPDKVSGERQHTGGWDLTFSAPKSVSVLAEITGNRELFKAHNDAVKEAVTWLEEEAATIRRTGWLGKKTELTGNLVVAMFQHDTSRAQDPQLHTHALVLNATQRDDGEWRSLHSRPLFEHKMAAGNVYRAALALSLQRAGFEIEQTHADGRFEIASVPQEILQTFSKRRADIEAKLASWNQEGAEMSARAALKTRQHKRPSSMAERRESWAAEAAALGFDPAQALREGMTGEDRTPPVSDRDKLAILRDAIDRLSEREAAFTNADLVGATLAAGMGKLNVADSKTIADEASRTKSEDLYEARIGERKAWTTPRAAQDEQRIEDLIERGRDSAEVILVKRAVEKVLRNSALNEGQRNAVKLIVSSKDQFVAVVGRPGTGKTTMVGSVKEILDREGYIAIGMAPNGAAAKELAEGGRLGVARTVASQIARVGKQVSQLKNMTPDDRDTLMAGFKKQVWIVDESSQLPNAEMRKLVQLASFTGAKVALIGDPAQLEAINAGRPFDRIVKNGVRQVEMTEIHRQRNPADRTLVQTAIDRDIAKAMTLLDPKIRELGDGREAALVRQWWTSENRAETLMISMRNEVKTRLNDSARDYLRDAGELGQEVDAKQLFPVFGQRADRQYAASYKRGDVLRFGVDHGKMEIAADSYWHVLQVKGKTSVNRLTISDGDKVLSFDARDAKGVLRHAEHFRPRTTTLAVNDRIVWNRPDRGKGLVNGDVLIVKTISERGIAARTSDGRSVEFDPDPRGKTGSTAQDQHWEHYYATSLYKSQGKTADHVLVDAPVQDAHMLNHHAFLVGVSRHRESVTFFTDDKAELAKRIVHNPGDKTSALEALGEERADRLRATVELISRAFGSSSRPSEPSPVESIMDSIRQSPELARDRERLPPRVAALLNREPTPAHEIEVPLRDPDRSIGL